MQNYSDEWDSLEEASKLFDKNKNNLNALSQVITKNSVAAAGINVDTPIVSAIIGNLTGALPTKKKYAKEVKCKICNCSVSSYIIFQRHTKGAKHQRKLKDLEVFSKLNDGDNNGIQKLHKNSSFPFMCEICPLEVNSAIQLQNHLSVLKLLCPLWKNKTFSCNSKRLPPLSVDILFRHNTGVKHKRRADRLKLFQLGKIQKNKSDKPGKSNQSVLTLDHQVKTIERNLFACYTCNILLNSKTQHNEHMNSKKHKIKEKLRQKLSHITKEENSDENSIYLLDDVLHENGNFNSKEKLTDKVY